MTPQTLLNALPATAAQFDQIQDLTAALTAFENLLIGGGDTALQQAITSDAEDCFALIATLLGISVEDARDALLALLGITQAQLVGSLSRTTKIVAFSCVVRQLSGGGSGSSGA
jgi:hypothetical protein